MMPLKGAKLWLRHGALEFKETVGDDLAVKFGVSFPQMIKLKPGETVVFSWIVFKSRAHRDRVNAKVMKDMALEGFTSATMPFDGERMMYGGFKTIVEGSAKKKR